MWPLFDPRHRFEKLTTDSHFHHFTIHFHQRVSTGSPKIGGEGKKFDERLVSTVSANCTVAY